MIVRIVMLALFTTTALAGDPPPIVITGDEQKQLDLTRPDGGLRAYGGVANIQVHHAEPGWTYNHHVDMACWKGRLYLAWDAAEKDEDVGVSRELYVTSVDGIAWGEPRELFPQGLSTHLRMFFFHAPNGRMLAIAGLRVSLEPLNERMKGPVIVREIRANHSLGPVHLLRQPRDARADAPPAYERSDDAGFVEACNQLLANKPFLEQSDYGNLVGDQRMKWHDVNAWPADEPSRGDFARFGKGTSFYHRKDGALVALMKWGWVLVSRDEGDTWSPPTRPPTFVCGMAKAWGQRTPDGRYALAYNPDLEKRYPLVVVTGDDGVTFGDMRVVHGERPPIRHAGLYKVSGPQYVRGISEWSTDRSRNDNGAFWLAYSVGKEDIWVSRVPMPAKADAWNVYSPKLAPVTVKDGEIVIEDHDPFDYARASRVLDGRKHVDVSFTVDAERGTLLLDFEGPQGQIGAQIGLRDGDYRVVVDCVMKTHSVWRDGKPLVENARLVLPIEQIERVSFRTGEGGALVEPTQFTIKAFKL